MTDQSDLIDRLGAAATEAKATIRELHEARRDVAADLKLLGARRDALAEELSAMEARATQVRDELDSLHERLLVAYDDHLDKRTGFSESCDNFEKLVAEWHAHATEQSKAVDDWSAAFYNQMKTEGEQFARDIRSLMAKRKGIEASGTTALGRPGRLGDSWR